MAKHQILTVIILAILALGAHHTKDLLAAEFDPAHPEWLFDEKWNPEGWGYHNDINIIEINEGTIKMETTGNDPWIFCGIGNTPLDWENQPAYLSVDADEHPTLYARMALSPSNNMIEFYYTTEEDPHWSGRQERRWQNLKPSGEMEEYEFDMGWQGTITGLRMDFAEVPGVKIDIEIDYLSFVGHPEPSEVVQPGDPEWNPPKHRIGIRIVEGVGEFYDRVTGKKFVPRGNNYIRLADQHELSGDTIFYHSTFNIDTYDTSRTALALQRMSQSGYNVVRVFLSQSLEGLTAGRDSWHGLSSDYLSNIADFLSHARSNGIYVMFTQDYLPDGKYGDVMGRDGGELFDGNCLNYLSEWGLRANQLFFQDFIEDLIKHDAPLDAVFAYELRNELYFGSDELPLSLHSRLVTTANGKTYDMASSEDKERMMDEGLVYWIDQVREAILEVTPDALVTVGFFVPQGPNPIRIGDPRLIETYPAIWESSADFIDLHAYPGWESLAQLVENFKINGMQRKPIIMGEFGAFKENYSSAGMAAQALQDWQVESCGYGFDGWLLWTWASDEQPHLYNALSDNEEINRLLAPVYRPDPCAPGICTRRNVALGKPATASSFLPDARPEMAVDGSASSVWSSGGDPPQWLEIDLGTPADISEIVLYVEQYLEGETTHLVWGRGPGENYRLLVKFSGFTRGGDWLTYTPIIPREGIQFIKLETVASPSQVAWGEIVVFSTEASIDCPWIVLNIPDQIISDGGTDTFADIRLDDYIHDFDGEASDIVWTNSESSILSVDISSDHIVTISVPDLCWSGSETIAFTATAPDETSRSDSATFTVLRSKTAYIIPSTITLEIGETQQFSISVYTLDDQKCDVTNSDMLWTVEGDIGSIDADGLFTAQRVGSGSIKATLRADTSVVAQSDTITVKYPPWDVNGDGIVDISDLMLVGNALGTSGEGLSADVNSDGVVDILDLIIVAIHYGETTDLNAPSAVHSPSSVHTNLLEQWLKAAKAADDGSETFRRGIAALERLLINIIPEQTALLQNYPNPFNPDTWIPYQLREDANVVIKIYTSAGRHVRTLNLGHKSAGIYTSKEKAAYWDGRNEEGEKTASGIYFYNIQAGDFSATKKMTIVE